MYIASKTIILVLKVAFRVFMINKIFQWYLSKSEDAIIRPESLQIKVFVIVIYLLING